MVTLDQMIKGQHVPGEQLAHTYGKGGPIMPSRKFNEQLGNLLGELHSTKLRVKGIRPHQMHSVIKSLMPMATKDEYIEDALFDLAELKGPLGEERCIIHGDLWRQNIFVDEQGNLTGLIDWEAKSKCNPHWEFRMVHRWIGWNGLEELLTHYHKHVPWKIDIDVVETSVSIIKNSDGSASEVSSNALSEASDIAINEAVIIREGLIDSLNPSFSPVLGSWSIWTEGKIVIGKTDASSTSSKKKNDAQTITLGFDRPMLSGDELMGFALSVGKDDVDIGTGLTNVKSNNFSLSTYNIIRPSSNTQLESVFGLGRLDFDTVRTDGSDTLTGTRKANQLFFSSSLRPQNTINLGNWQFSPYSKVSFAKTNLKAFSESGASTALTYDKQKLNDTLMGIGMDISSQITTGNSKIKPYAKIELNQSSSKTSASMNYNNENAYTHSYTTSLNRKHKNWKMKLGLDLDTESGWDTSFTYTREQSIGSSANSKNSNSFSFNAGMSF